MDQVRCKAPQHQGHPQEGGIEQGGTVESSKQQREEQGGEVVAAVNQVGIVGQTH
jgi:hypothetical protein